MNESDYRFFEIIKVLLLAGILGSVFGLGIIK